MAETRMQRDTQAEASLPWLPPAAWDSSTIDEISTGEKTFGAATPANTPESQPSPASAPPMDPAVTSLPPDMPNPPEEDLRQQLWQEWAEKFRLVLNENAALREQANLCRQDGLQDIRVDSVASIENEALKGRIAELEKEIEDMRSKKEKNAKNVADGTDSPLSRQHAE